MFAMDQTKTQDEEVLSPDSAPPGVVVSPDTRDVRGVPSGA
jgi:hypothetical protein